MAKPIKISGGDWTSLTRLKPPKTNKDAHSPTKAITFMVDLTVFGAAKT